jgi:dihydroorotase
MQKKIIIKGGKTFLEDETIEKRDILISGSHIEKIAKEIAAIGTEEIIDASAKLVTPGLIDYHMHAFRYGHFLSVDTDAVAPRSGTTTFVDGGSSGSLNFMAFREYVIKPAKTNILAFLNISAIGQTTDGVKGLDFHDNDSDQLLHIPSALEIIEKNLDIIVGIKVRAYTGLKTLRPMERARELADLTDLPIMVHLAPAPPKFVDLLPYLKAGDVITHPYHGGNTTILDQNDHVRPEYWEAKKKGVEVDLGLDRFHGDLEIMRKAIDQGYLPDYISTDLAATNIDSIVFDLPTTIAKAMACGMAMPEVLARSTRHTAIKLGREKEIGVLAVGATADIGIFDIVTEPMEMKDFFGHKIRVEKRLIPFITLRQGQILLPINRETETLDVLNRANPWHAYK